MPCGPSAIRGTASASWRGVRACASMSAVVAKPVRVSRVIRVGASSLSDSLRAIASAGLSQSCSTSSTSSWADSWAPGASAKKNRVSQRLARIAGVTQRVK